MIDLWAYLKIPVYAWKPFLQRKVRALLLTKSSGGGGGGDVTQRFV